MKKEYLRIIPIMILSVCTVLFYSCKDTNTEKLSAETQLTSFGPSGVFPGEDISFMGSGLDKVTSIVLPVGVEVPQSAFKSQTANMIVLTVPIETTVGKVTLKTPQGDILTKSMFGPSVIIAITTMTPEAKPGTNITITGEFLNFVRQISFGKNKLVTEFVSQSRTELVVKVPMDAQTGTITLSDGAKADPQLVESKDKLIVTLPVASSLSPLSIKHSDNLTITGTNLDLVDSVNFPNGKKGVVVGRANFVSQSETTIVVAVPNTATNGALTLKVASSLTVVPSQQISIMLPTATAFSLNSSPGATLIITGTDLDLVKSITFPGVLNALTTFSSQSPTQIVLTIPANAAGGSLKFTTIHDYNVIQGLPFGDQSLLLYTVYDDALKSPWSNWSWGGPTDVANTEQAATGSKSIKKTYSAGYEGVKLANSSVSIAGYTKISALVYGGPGTNGKKIRLVINGGYSGGQYASFTIVEGQWKEFQAAFSEVNNPTTINEFVFQSEFAGIVYYDKIGLK